VNIVLDLIAIAFAKETTAAEAAAELERRSDELAIDPDAIGVFICERDASCQLITKRQPDAMAAWSEFWSRILEVLMDGSREAGIDVAFRSRVTEMLTPGTSILMAVVPEARAGGAVDALSHYGGRSLTCPLSENGLAELRDTLEADPAES
jgi:uncharacterized membrane protein